MPHKTSRIVRTGTIAGLLMLGSACIALRPTRTYDYADVSAHPSATCEALRPPAQDACGENAMTDTDVLASGKPRRASNSSVCTTIDDLTNEGSVQQYNATRVAGSSVVQCFSHERFPASAESTSLPHDPFDLHVIEFDDEGQPWNAEREDLTLEALRRELQEPAVVVTFVHGWKDNADVCNENLACFRQVLEVLAKAEKLYSDFSGAPPRRVVGVYIGWRGGTFSVEPLKTGVTFWGRKHTAHVIGDNGGVTALIRRIRTIVDQARLPQQPQSTGRNLAMTSHVLIGHSFGGALLLSAVGTSLNGSIGQALQSSLNRDSPVACGPEPEPPTVAPSAQTETRGRSPSQPLLNATRQVYVETQGDLVILVNPATEGSRFANLNQAAQVPFHPCQIPIFVTLASEADWAVGALFPIGQSLATLLRSARSRAAWFSMVEGLGLYEPYHTHRLSMKALPDIPVGEQVSGHCACPSNLRAYGDALVRRLQPLYEAVATAYTPTELRLAAYQEFLFSRLEPIQDVDPNNPFMTIQVDREIIAGHSDIFNARFLDFLIEFIVRTEVKRELVRLESSGRAK